MGSVVGVVGLSIELNGVSSDTSEFLLTKANNSIDFFSHEDTSPCDLLYPEKSACLNSSTNGLFAFPNPGLAERSFHQVSSSMNF
jgi:hypothetical protein